MLYKAFSSLTTEKNHLSAQEVAHLKEIPLTGFQTLKRL